VDAFTPELLGTVTGAESLTGVTGLTIAEVKVGSHGAFLSMTTHASSFLPRSPIRLLEEGGFQTYCYPS